MYYDFFTYELAANIVSFMKLFKHRPVSGTEEPESLMLKVKAGDRKAFTTLYERFKGPIFFYLTGFVGRNAVAEDLAHEVFLKMYRSRENYESTARFTTWLWTIARNTALDEVRKKGELLADTEDSFPEVASDPDLGAEALLVERARQAQVENCLSELPARQRDAVMLRIAGDHSYEEIAGIMVMSLANVKNLLHRAKAALTKCLEGSV